MKYLKIVYYQYKDRKNIVLFLNWLILRIKKLFKIQFTTTNCNIEKRIDIVIPTISKDFELLDLVLESLKNLQHSINNIYIVAPNIELIKLYCDKKKLIFIDEISVNGFGKDYINYIVNGKDRSGWLFQQLLKLSGEKFTEMEDYLIVDSDTIYTNKNCFITKDNKYIFYENDEWNQSYFDSFEKIFGYKAPSKLSLTSHMMIFNHSMLKNMKKELENKHNKPWYDVYISTSSPYEKSCISDYDTYANWVLANFKAKVLCKPFYNKSVSRNKLDKLENLEKNFLTQKSISFHSYIDGSEN